MMELAELRGLEFHRAMANIARDHTIPRLHPDFVPERPMSRPATLTATDDHILSTMAKASEGGKLGAHQGQWYAEFAAWRGAVHKCEVRRQSKAWHLLLTLYHADAAGDAGMVDELQCFLGAEWGWGGEMPTGREHADRIAAGLARCPGVMSNALFYGEER